MPFPNKETQFKTGEKQVKIARKGGLSKSPKKSLAAKKRWLIKKGMTKEGADDLLSFVKDHEMFALDVLRDVQNIKKECTNAHQKINLKHVELQLYKLIHGEKIKTENVHHHIDWNTVLNKCVVSDGDSIRMEEDT